jgi:formylglycine-generating enzyme required for sulfatase activity
LSAVEERARRARIEAAEANARAAREEARAERARAAAEKERLRADHARRARRTGAIVLAATVVVAAVVSALLDARRREAQAARHETQQALTRVLQLADVKRARDLVEQEETLWPIHPDRVAAMAHWLERAEALLSRRAGHEQSLADVRGRALPYTPEDRARDQGAAQPRLREITDLLAAMEQELRLLDGEEAEASRAAYARRAEALTAERDDLLARAGERRTWRFASDEDAWRHQTLTDLLGDVRLLEGERVAQVRARKESAASLRTRSIDEHRDAWAQTIADVRAAKGYAGLVLVPQQGLVPLGPDPQSGLLEFAHVGSGSIPYRAAETGALVCAEDAAIVLVLLPGGTDWLGAQASDPNGPNYDPDAGPDEGPVHQVTLTPFLLAKHELTQSQWTTLTGGQRPSGYPAGRVVAGRHLTERNPVEQVSWELCARWMTRHRLELPTEAQWEYACRAGTDTPWVTGREMADVGRVANVADATMRRYEPTREGVLFALEIEDGHGVHAPVGSFAPNSFGLHDMHGNVWEWCSDFHGPYTAEPATDPLGEAAYAGRGGRIARGGAFFAHPRRARSSYRRNHSPRAQYFVTGLRPAATLQR